MDHSDGGSSALCRRLDLFGRELLAVDGTRLKAVNNPGRNFSRAKLTRCIAAADERLEAYLAELDAIDRGEDGHGPSRSEALAAKIAHVRAGSGRRKRRCWTRSTPAREPGLADRARCARDGHG